MDQDLYDEFGNYVGPGFEEDSDAGLDSDLSQPESEAEPEKERVVKITRESIVSFEDEEKRDEVYGDAEVFIREEDTQTIEVPIVKAEEAHVERVHNIRRLDSDVSAKNFDIMEERMPRNRFSFQFLASLMSQPQFIRNIAIAGSLHDGKSTLVDRLIEHSRFMEPDSYQRKGAEFVRYTDARLDEQARELSIKSTPISLVFQNTLYEDVEEAPDHPKCKSYLFNIMDTPGHVNFMDEFVHALPLADGCVLVVDVLMGLTSVLEGVIRQCVCDGVKMCLVVNCLDRLVLEVKLPPEDAYLKISHTIGEVNSYLQSVCALLGREAEPFDPRANNVAFASSLFGIFFTLKSFAKLYTKTRLKQLSQRLYGDYFYNQHSNTIVTTSTANIKSSTGKNTSTTNGTNGVTNGTNGTTNGTGTTDTTAGGKDMDEDEGDEDNGGSEEVELKRTFVSFILEPIYKLIAHVASDEREQLEEVLAEFDIRLKRDDYKLNTRRILRKVCSLLFTDASAFVDMVICSVPSALENNLAKFRAHYSGELDAGLAEEVRTCNAKGRLLLFVTKNYFRSSEGRFDLFGRVFSGSLSRSDEVKLLGPSYTLDDDEDLILRRVDALWIPEARYRVELSRVGAGNWVLLSGIDLCHFKTATLTHANESGVELMRLSSHIPATKPVFKVGLEPLNPNELPRMINGLRAVEKSYPAAQVKVEESGEHVVLGTGELYLDCVLHDLRRLFGNLEIKVSDPVVRFTETIMESSSMRCFANTTNQKNKLFMLSQPLEKGLSNVIEDSASTNPALAVGGVGATTGSSAGTSGSTGAGGISNSVFEKFGWDKLDINNIWSFGPDERGPNVLINDTIPSEVNVTLLNQVRGSIIQGFNWATKEGPLIEEPIRNVKFRLIGCELSNEYINIAPGQIIPATRRLCYSSFLLSTPRLMEPVVFAEVTCPADCVSNVYTILSRRRGHVLRDMPRPGTPFYIVHAYLPAIESFGFETDLRVHTSGQAFCLTMFDHWNIVPGDPLDKSIVLKPLEPAPIPHLAREFLLKTRKRKGLTEDVSINAFFDDVMLASLAENLQEFY